MTAAEIGKGLQEYSAYKDSGVEWFGQIPEGWEVQKLKQATTYVARGESPTYSDSSQFWVINQSCIRWSGIDFDKKKFQDEGMPPEKGLLKDKDLIINSTGHGTLGRSTVFHDIPGQCCMADNHVTIIRTQREKLVPAFLNYAISTDQFQRFIYATLIVGATAQIELSRGALRNTDFPLPSILEQRAIVTFLDQETVRIDELLLEQERLLRDLTVKRQATTNSATFAFPAVSSEQIPTTWRIVPLKSVLISMEQGWSPQCENQPAAEGEWGVLKVGCVNGHRFNAEENKALPMNLEPLTRYALKRDDVLISRANTRDLVGSAARVEQDYPSLLLCDKLYRLRPYTATLLPSYLVLLLSSPLARAAIEMTASGASSSMLNISQATVKNLMIPLPPLAEQQAITEQLDHTLAQLDQLVSEVRASMELMRQHRSALITAAVTGKIDVRELI